MDCTLQTLLCLIKTRLFACAANDNIHPATDWKLLYSLSLKHDVAHIVGAVLGKSDLLRDCPEVSEAFQKQVLLAVFRHEQLAFALQQTCDALEAAEVKFLPLKGAVMRAYYPEPWMRTSSDIDILVMPEDLDRAVALLVEQYGYRFDRKSLYDVSLYTPEGMHIELHYDLIEEGIVGKAHEVLREIWQDATPVEGYTYRYRSSDAFFYFYHIAHMAKHVLQGGCGIRPFLDLWLLDTRVTPDAQRDELLEKGGLAKFADVVRRLTACWFSGEALDETTEEMQRYVLSGGVYGNKKNHVKMKQSKRGGRLAYALSKIFLPYDVIKFQYPVLQKHRWLTPFCEVRRWCSLIFCGGAKRSLHELSINASQSKEDMKRTADFIDRIGL